MNKVLGEQLLELSRQAATRQLEVVRASPFAAGLDDEGVRRRADLQRWLRAGQEVSFRPNRNSPWQQGIFLDMAAQRMDLRVLVRGRGQKEQILCIDPAKMQVATRLERRQLQLEAKMASLQKELDRYSKRGESLQAALGELYKELAGITADIRVEKTRVSALLPKEKEVRA